MCTNAAAPVTTSKNYSTVVAEVSAEENAGYFAANYFMRKRNAKDEFSIHQKRRKVWNTFLMCKIAEMCQRTFLVESLQHCFAQPCLLHKYLAIHGPSSFIPFTHNLILTHLCSPIYTLTLIYIHSSSSYIIININPLKHYGVPGKVWR